MRKNSMSDLTNWVILRFEHIAPFTLKLYFADHTEQLINFEPVLRGAWLRPLRDLEYFRQARLNDTGNLEWPDRQDFNPEALHDWPAFEQLYIQDGQNAEKAENISKIVKTSDHTDREKRVRISKRNQLSQNPHPAKAG